jgi:hypothetical protein
MYKLQKLKTRLLYFLLIFALISFEAQAQGGMRVKVDRHVIGSAGEIEDTAFDNSGNPQFILDWTIGEVFVETLQGSKKRVTQGFHQNLWQGLSDVQKSSYIFSVLDQDSIKQHFSVFPNPFVNNLSVKWNFEEEKVNLLFEIYDLYGKRFFSERRNANDAQLLIQLHNLKPQMYILRVSDPSRGFLETHKIVKL